MLYGLQEVELSIKIMISLNTSLKLEERRITVIIVDWLIYNLKEVELSMKIIVWVKVNYFCWFFAD